MRETSSCGARLHLMIIRFCLSISQKSASAYDQLMDTFGDVIKLPSRRTLRDYKNWIRPKTGFQKEVVVELTRLSDSHFDIQRYVVILIDEMKVKSNLVFDKHSGQLIGFVDLGSEEHNFATLEKEDELATHVLVIIVKGLCTDLNFCLAYFATTNVTSVQLMPIFWEAVGILEMTCNLWLVAITADGASSNRSFFKMHKALHRDSGKNACYRTVNLYARDRFIYFFSDARHLVKTARNCLFHSGQGKHSRLMWNDGEYLMWEHISKLYFKDLERDIKLLPRLSYDHIKLTPFSVMRVNLAAQVLSKTTSLILKNYGSKDAVGTAVYCEMFDTFYDCFNVRSQLEHIKKIKPFLAPYTSPDDPRFEWLENCMLGYLHSWKESIEKRPGDFSKSDHSKMFISWQTMEGIEMNVAALPECIKFLLSEGFEYVMTDKLCQDAVEEYFGGQRKLGRRSDNPDIYIFGYNNNALHNQCPAWCSN
eukprot:gene1641-1822_t